MIGFTTVVVWPFTFYSALEASRLLQTVRMHWYRKQMARRTAR